MNLDLLRRKIQAEENVYVEFLKDCLLASFKGVADFQIWIAHKMEKIGLDVEQFIVHKDELKKQPAMQRSLQSEAITVGQVPNFIGRLGKGSNEVGQRGLTVFAHADKPIESYEWGKRFRPDTFQQGQKLVGPGIGDDVAGIAAAMSALKVLRDLGWSPRYEVRFASVLGKQLGVFGTYGLVAKYKPSDAAIYVHPPASGGGLGDLIIGALGMVEFSVKISGKAPETTEPWKPIFEKTAINPIYKGLYLISALRVWGDEIEKQKVYHHEGVEAVAGRSFVVHIGQFLAGESGKAYQFPPWCVFSGVVHFSPRASVKDIQQKLTELFNSIKVQDAWFSEGNVYLEWGDVIAEAFEVDPNHVFVKEVRRLIQAATGVSPRFYYGHSVSDIRYPVLWWGVPAVGVGPVVGNLGKPDEYIDKNEYLTTIAVLAMLIAHFA